jgi:hypothetical protein
MKAPSLLWTQSGGLFTPIPGAAAATTGEIAFVPFGRRLFWVSERPKNADSSSAFAIDIRGNRQK